MSSSVGSQLPVLVLCKTIKALVTKGDSAIAKGEQFYIAAGRHLAELKERRPRDISWAAYVEKKCKISRSRAAELIAIGDGRTTLQELRANNAKRQAKTKLGRKTAVSNGRKRSYEMVDEPDDDDEGQTPEERWQYSLANFCGDIIAMQSYWHKHFDGWESFECPPHIQKLVKEAAAELTSITATISQ